MIFHWKILGNPRKVEDRGRFRARQVGDEVTKDEPITTNPNVGGFGQEEKECILQDMTLGTVGSARFLMFSRGFAGF